MSGGGAWPSSVLATSVRNRVAESAAACNIGEIKPAALAGLGSLPIVTDGRRMPPRQAWFSARRRSAADDRGRDRERRGHTVAEVKAGT